MTPFTLSGAARSAAESKGARSRLEARFDCGLPSLPKDGASAQRDRRSTGSPS
jgi:hypothetical protein